MRYIESTHLNREQATLLQELQHQQSRKYHNYTNVHWHIVRKIRPISCNILAYIDHKHLAGFTTRYLFHDNECEICIMMHPKYASKLFAKQLFYKLLNYIPKDAQGYLVLAKPEAEPIWLKPELPWQALSQSLRLQWQGVLPNLVHNHELDICKAGLDDYTAFKNILSRCFPKATEMNPSIYEVIIASHTTQIYILKKNQETIGSIQINQESKWLRISDLAILPEHQSRGYGKYLLLHILQQLQQRSKNICLDVDSDNTHAYEWYLQLGFKKINTTELWRIPFKDVL